ncbi:hypothetical protein C8R43DRAFT_959921 [Mycena crocata]|nr:hypothetical protein C8R43DRAFT_959921 [Mycena crocata]
MPFDRYAHMKLPMGGNTPPPKLPKAPKPQTKPEIEAAQRTKEEKKQKENDRKREQKQRRAERRELETAEVILTSAVPDQVEQILSPAPILPTSNTQPALTLDLSTIPAVDIQVPCLAPTFLEARSAHVLPAARTSSSPTAFCIPPVPQIVFDKFEDLLDSHEQGFFVANDGDGTLEALLSRALQVAWEAGWEVGRDRGVLTGKQEGRREGITEGRHLSLEEAALLRPAPIVRGLTDTQTRTHAAVIVPSQALPSLAAVDAVPALSSTPIPRDFSSLRTGSQRPFGTLQRRVARSRRKTQCKPAPSPTTRRHPHDSSPVNPVPAPPKRRAHATLRRDVLDWDQDPLLSDLGRALGALATATIVRCDPRTPDQPIWTAPTPYEISEVCAAAESYFKRDKFSMMLIGADRLGIESMDETSDEDTSDEESSEDDSDREKRKRQKKKKILRRKKRASSAESLTDNKYDTAKKDVKTEEVEGMIRQLNSMSLDDPSYGATYFKVLSMDTTGIAAKCVRAPKLRDLLQKGIIKRDEASHKLVWADGSIIRCFRDESFVSAVERLRPAEAHYARKSSMRSYPRQMPENYPVQKTRWVEPEYDSDEDWDLEYDDIAQSHFISVAKSKLHRQVKGYYSRYAPRPESPGSDTYTVNFETATEQLNSEDSQSEDHTDAEYDNSVYVVPRKGRLEVYPVEKGEKSITANRKAKFDGVHVPGPETRAKLRGKLPTSQEAANPIRPSTRSQGPLKKNILIPQKTPFKPKIPTYIPTEPTPIDVRDVRTSPESRQEEMMLDETAKEFTQDKENKSIHTRKPGDVPVNSDELRKSPKARNTNRQSELSAEVNHDSVIRKVLNSEVTLSVKDVLGASRELSSALLEMIKVKNQGTHKVGLSIEGETCTSNWINDLDDTVVAQTRIPRSRGMLIDIELECDGRKPMGIIDTGSQLNIVREDIAQMFIRKPFDLHRSIKMNDANGGEGQLKGLISNVTFRCGAVDTSANLFVGEKSPFTLLLGRPWQRGNRVSIDERNDGTYLVFKDPETCLPRYECLVTPDDQDRSGNRFVAHSSYTITVDDSKDPQENCIQLSDHLTAGRNDSVESNSHTKPLGELMWSDRARNLLMEDIMLGRLSLAIIQLTAGIIFNILAAKLVKFIKSESYKISGTPETNEPNTTYNLTTALTHTSAQNKPFPMTEPTDHLGRRYPQPEMIHAPGPYDVHTTDMGISIATVDAEIRRQRDLIATGGTTHIRPISITTAQGAYCSPTIDMNGIPSENIIMPNAQITIFNTLTGLYSTHMSHLIIQGFPMNGSTAASMPLPLPTETELRSAMIRCQPDQPSLPNVELLLDLYDPASLFQQCAPQDWCTRLPNQSYDFQRDRIPPIPGFAFGLSNSITRTPFAIQLLQARWSSTTSSYLDQRVVPAFIRVQIYLETTMDSLPMDCEDDYTVAYRTIDASGHQQLFLPLIDLFIHILERSYGYSAVDDSGIYLPRVDHILHEFYNRWRYIPQKIQPDWAEPYVSETDLKCTELIPSHRISFAKDLLMADSDSDRRNPFLRFLPPLESDYYPTMAADSVKQQRIEYSSSEPAESSPSTSEISLFEGELQYPDSPAVTVTSTVPVHGSETPELEENPSSPAPRRPLLIRLPPFSALVHGLRSHRAETQDTVEPMPSPLTPLSPLPGIGLKNLDIPNAEQTETVPVLHNGTLVSESSAANKSPDLNENVDTQPNRKPLFLPTDESDSDMPDLISVSNSEESDSDSDHDSAYYDQLYSYARSQQLPRRFRTGDRCPLSEWPSFMNSPTVFAVYVPEGTSAPDEFTMEFEVPDTQNEQESDTELNDVDQEPESSNSSMPGGIQNSSNPSTIVVEAVGQHLPGSNTQPALLRIVNDSGAPLYRALETGAPPTPDNSDDELAGMTQSIASLGSGMFRLFREDPADSSDSAEIQEPLMEGPGRIVRIPDRGRHYRRLFEAATYREVPGSPIYHRGFKADGSYIFQTSKGTFVPPPVDSPLPQNPDSYDNVEDIIVINGISELSPTTLAQYHKGPTTLEYTEAPYSDAVPFLPPRAPASDLYAAWLVKEGNKHSVLDTELVDKGKTNADLPITITPTPPIPFTPEEVQVRHPGERLVSADIASTARFYMTRAKRNEFIVDAAKHREDPDSPLYYMGDDPQTQYPIYRTSLGTIVPPPGQPPNPPFLPITSSDPNPAKVAIINDLGNATTEVLARYLTTLRQAIQPQSHMTESEQPVQQDDNESTILRTLHPLSRRRSSHKSGHRVDVLTMDDLDNQNSRPGAPYLPRDTRIVRNPRNPPRKRGMRSETAPVSTALRRTFAVADLNALSRNPELYLSQDSSSDLSSDEDQVEKSYQDIREESAIIQPIHQLEQSHPKVYSMMHLPTSPSQLIHRTSRGTASPTISALSITFERPSDPDSGLTNSEATQPMTFEEFLDHHKDKPEVMEYLQDPVVYSIIKNVLSRGSRPEIQALRDNLSNIRDFRSFRSTLVNVLGKTDAMLTRRRLHDPVRSLFRTSTNAKFDGSETSTQYNLTQDRQPITQAAGNVFLIAEEEAFLIRAIHLLSDNYSLDVSQALAILLRIRFPNDAGIRLLVNTGCLEPPEYGFHPISA